MMAQRVQVFQGPDAVKATDALRLQRANQEAWPYTHIYPPRTSKPVHVIDSASVAAGTTEVLAYTVPSGFEFVFEGLVQTTSGAGAFVVGLATWTVDINTPTGVANVQASPIQGLSNLPVPLGDFSNTGPWRFLMPYILEPLTVVRSKATNIGLGAGTYVSGFFGWLLPVIKAKR